MSTENITAPTAPATAKKTRKTRAPKAPRQPRAVDPQVAAIKAEAKQKLAALKAEKRSGKVLANITAMLGKLTLSDKALLVGALPHIQTDPAAAVITGEA